MGGGRKNQRGGHRLCPQKAEQYRESSPGGGHLAMPSSLPGQRGVGRHSTSEAARAVATLCHPSAEQEVYRGEGLAGGELTWAVGPNPALQISF